MLPKPYRLKKRSAFNATYKSGKCIYAKGLTIFCGKEKKDQAPAKIGIVVSKKIHKRAVKRNRIKRLLRESLRLIIKDSSLIQECKYMSLIILASSLLLEKNFSEVDVLVKNALRKLQND